MEIGAERFEYGDRVVQEIRDHHNRSALLEQRKCLRQRARQCRASGGLIVFENMEHVMEMAGGASGRKEVAHRLIKDIQSDAILALDDEITERRRQKGGVIELGNAFAKSHGSARVQ